VISLCIESVIRSLLSNSGLELSGTASLEAADTWMLPRRDVPLPPNTDRRIVLRKLSMFLIESRSRRCLTSEAQDGFQAHGPQSEIAWLESVMASNLHFFLDTAVRKDYIHGALISYSELFSGNNRLDPVQARTYLWLPTESASWLPGSVVLLQFDATCVGTLRLFTLSAFNSRLGG